MGAYAYFRWPFFKVVVPSFGVGWGGKWWGGGGYFLCLFWGGGGDPD